MTSQTDRFSRQEGIVPRNRLVDTPITIIGVGAGGRQVALQLASIGAARMQIIDFDQVDESNITTQGYFRDEVGRNKVDAMREAIHRIDSSIQVEAVCDRYRPKLEVGEAVFCCVDSIDARSIIWRTVSPHCFFWADGRMRGEVMRCLAVDGSDEAKEAYAKTLFPEAEAQTGSCTAKGTIYCATILAGLMVHQFTRWLRNMPLDRDALFNLLANELAVA